MISNIWGQIGDTYYKLDDLNSAFEAYDEALKYDDKNISVLNNYSYFLSLGNQDLSKAERMAAQAIKLEPNNMTFLDTYAWIFFKQGNYTLAKFYIESALNKNEEVNAEILEHYGDILFKLNETDKAVEQWEKALEVLTDEDTNINVPVLKKKVETRSYIE